MELGNSKMGCSTVEQRVRPRAAVHVSNDLHAMILNQFSTDDMVTVRLCRGREVGGDFVVVSLYPMNRRCLLPVRNSKQL